MGQNKRDTMIRCTPETSKNLMLIAVTIGVTKKEFLSQLSKILLNNKEIFKMIRLNIKDN